RPCRCSPTIPCRPPPRRRRRARAIPHFNNAIKTLACTPQTNVLERATMELNRRQLTIAATLLIGLPLVIHLWGGVIDRFSNPASTHVANAERAIKKGQYIEAMTALVHASEVKPGDAEVQRLMMKARAFLAAEQP